MRPLWGRRSPCIEILHHFGTINGGIGEFRNLRDNEHPRNFRNCVRKCYIFSFSRKLTSFLPQFKYIVFRDRTSYYFDIENLRNYWKFRNFVGPPPLITGTGLETTRMTRIQSHCTIFRFSQLFLYSYPQKNYYQI